MTVTKVVRYRTRDTSAADENARLIEAVFAELAVKAPAGLKYSALRLDDGLSFVHVAEFASDENPLNDCAAFAEFQSGIRDRVDEGPIAADATVVGSFGA